MGRIVHIVNRTRGGVLAERAGVADNMVSRFFGLMGQRGLEPGAGLLIIGDNAIHSFFMRCAFDACFVDRDNKVLFMLHAMKPWRASRFVRGGRSVLELPAGVLAATDTTVGDQLAVTEVAG